jgi:glycosyltransferase involved in cell wall biosynthesis
VFDAVDLTGHLESLKHFTVIESWSVRVFHVIDRLDPFGGASIACLRLAQPLAASVSVTVVSRQPDETLPQGLLDQVQTVFWRQTPNVELLEHALQDADVVHLHGIWDPALRLAAQVCRSLDTPYAVTPHGMLAHWPMAQKRLKKRVYLATLGRPMLWNAANVHFTAEQEKEQSQRHLRHNRTWVCPLINDLGEDLAGPNEVEQRLQGEAEDPKPLRLLFLSRLNPKKGPDLAIESLAHLPGVILQIAGRDDPGYRGRLKAQAESLGVADRIEWIGEVSENRKRELYRRSDLFILPSHQENFGQVLVEAMANGLPVLTTKNVDIWQELQSGGALIAPADAKAVAGRIASLIGPRRELACRSAEAREFVRRWLDVSAARDRYIAWYEGLIGANQQASR